MLLTQARDLHAVKDFAGAVTVYQRIVAEWPETKEASTARTQVENLRSSVSPETLHLAVRPPPADDVPTPKHIPAPQLPPVLHELRQLLETKPFVDLANLDDLLVARQTDDALELLRQLVVVGNITQVQADALVAEFGEHRLKSAGDVVASAHGKVVVPAAVTQSPQMKLAVRSFILSKKLVPAEKLEPLLASKSNDDVATLFRQLVVLGLITQVQADALMGDFHQRQMALARSIINTARGRGFIPGSHAEQALASYAPVALTVSVHDHLVSSQLLTRAQADGLHQRRGLQGLQRLTRAKLLVGGLAIIILIGVVALLARKRENAGLWTGTCPSSGSEIQRAYDACVAEKNPIAMCGRKVVKARTGNDEHYKLGDRLEECDSCRYFVEAGMHKEGVDHCVETRWLESPEYKEIERTVRGQ